MRQITMLIPTLREAPAEAEAASHILLLRAGFIRQLASGVYSYLPLGWRVLDRIASIVRQEMNGAGTQELLMPAMQPAELWEKSGRYSHYGPELIRYRDRHQREFVLGPTHEEVITMLLHDELVSYRQLPMMLYQVQTKFRDERRPRFGLLRGREFLMKDAYSFDVSWEGLNVSYRSMYAAYVRIFERCELRFRAVEADAGTIGGEGETHEFMALADIGEDTVVSCSHCGYSANLEKAEASIQSEAHLNQDGYKQSTAEGNITELRHKPEMFPTPQIRTIEDLVHFLQVEASDIVKTLIYLSDGKPIAVLVRGNHEVNEAKVRQYLGTEILEMADAAVVEEMIGAPVGFVGPVGLTIPVLVDREVSKLRSCVTGANKKDYHYRYVNPGRDFSLRLIGDFRNVVSGEPCARCAEGSLEFHRGIEVGHVFKLGTKYSSKLNAAVRDSEGKNIPLIMGCYGIGLSRLLAAVVEQSHDGLGIIWPTSLAPFLVHIIPISINNEAQAQVAEELYARLNAVGIETLMDDRDERPGVKFKDSDLIGIPWRIVVGKQVTEGIVELIDRRTHDSYAVTTNEVIARLHAIASLLK